MKIERNTQNRLGKELQTLLAPYPDPMSRTDFRKACQIGTRTSLYLLKSGLVPCTHTGKKTRCYKIAKADVAEYLRRREAEPDYYKPPSGWYSNYPDKKILKKKEARQQILQGKSRAEKLADVKRKLEDYPDVLTSKQISELTGYSPHTVACWCRTGSLRSIPNMRNVFVPQSWLLDFLCSEKYKEIVHKSE